MFTIIKIGIVMLLIKWTIGLSFNVVFSWKHKPYLWILLMVVLGFVVVFLSRSFGWSEDILPASVPIAVLWLIPEDKRRIKNWSEDFYEETGIKKGRRLYYIGLSLFVIVSFVFWVVYYGDSG